MTLATKSPNVPARRPAQAIVALCMLISVGAGVAGCDSGGLPGRAKPAQIYATLSNQERRAQNLG